MESDVGGANQMGKLGEQCPRSDLKRRDRCEKSATDAAYRCENCRKEYVRRKWFDKHQKVCKRNNDPQGWKQVSLKKWLRTSPEQQQQQHPVSTENRFWPLRLHQKGGYPDRLKIIIFANNDTTNNERKSEIITSLNIPKNVRIRFRGKKGGARTELWFPSRRDLLAYFEEWGKKGKKLGFKMRLGRTYSEREACREKAEQTAPVEDQGRRPPTDEDPNHHRKKRERDRQPTTPADDTNSRTQNKKNNGKPIRILQWNARSLKRKIPELQMFIEEKEIDIALISEARLRHEYRLPKALNQFEIHINERNNREGGGTAILIKRNLGIFENVKKHQNQHFEYIKGDLLQPNQPPITLISCYYPREVTQTGNDIEEMISGSRPRTLIGGDFNAKHKAWGSTITRPAGIRLLDNITEANAKVINSKQHTYQNEVTGNMDTLDLTIVTIPLSEHVINWEVEEDLGGSDHFPIVIDLKGVGSNDEEGNPKEKWNINKADWSKYNAVANNMMEALSSELDEARTEDLAALLTQTIGNAAKEAIPRTTKKKRKHRKPWWTDHIKKLILEKKRKRRQWQKRRTRETRAEFKRAEAEVRRDMLRLKRETWRIYVQGINNQTPSSIVWRKFKAIDGGIRHPRQAIQAEGRVVTEEADKVEEFASFFAEKSTRNDLLQERGVELNTPMENAEDLETADEPISIEEIKKALMELNKRSPGPDEIHDEMLLNLPERGLEVLCKVFNRYWNEGIYPNEWKTSVLIPVPKPGKPLSRIDSYRPIALTSAIGKLFERIIRERLNWALESRRQLSSMQFGFRPKRGTIDYMLKLTDNIHEALEKKLILIAVFIDIEKAFDRVWREGMTTKLFMKEVGNRSKKVLESFLEDRIITARLGNEESTGRPTNAGIPQGSVVSPTLFNIMLADLDEVIKDTNGAIYADDLTVWVSAENAKAAREKMQSALTKIQEWMTKWKFTMSATKTEFSIFTRKRIKEPERTTLLINGNQLNYNPNPKVLGLVLDQKLTWKAHIEYIKTAAIKRLNLLKLVANKKWGSDYHTLRTLYVAYIRSKIAYGCEVWGHAAKTHITELEKIQNAALRLIIGALKTTPVHAMRIEANLPSLALYFEQMSLKKWIKGRYDKGKKTTPNSHFQTMNRRNARYIGLPTHEVCQDIENQVPPWKKPSLKIRTEIDNLDQKQTIPEATQKILTEKDLQERYSTHTKIYTDGSLNREEQKAGAGIYIPVTGATIHIPLQTKSIVDAEMTAIHRAIQEIIERAFNKTVILTDSKTSLQILTGNMESHTTGKSIMRLIHDYEMQNNEIWLQWIPGHCGLDGNDKADEAAKIATEMGPVNAGQDSQLSELQELRFLIAERIKSEWREARTGRSYFSLQPTPMKRGFHSLSREQQSALSQLRLGHFPSDSYLVKIGKKTNAECSLCRQREGSVRHILLECAATADLRAFPDGVSLVEILGEPAWWSTAADIAIHWRREASHRGSTPECRTPR